MRLGKYWSMETMLNEAWQATVLGFVQKMGKILSQLADFPGFLANRILMPFINEAVICLETGVGQREDIDMVYGGSAQ